jgi:hypothetical protein
VTFNIGSPVAGGVTFATGSVTSVRGERALGFYRLNMTIEFVIEPASTSGEQQVSPHLTEFAVEARIGGRSMGRFVPISPGYLPIRAYAGHSNRTSVPLTCDLDRARIEAIENVRNGGSLQLDLSFQGRFNEGSAFSAGEPYPIHQGVWVDVLAEMEYRRTLLIEVPAPDPQTQPELAEAVGLLSQAQRHLSLGHDRDAVGSLRDVLEQIKLAFNDDDSIDPQLQRVLFENSRSMSKADRLRVLRRALMLVTHPARHRDQLSVAIEWSRIDATQMITMTAAFLNEMSAPDARPQPRESAAAKANLATQPNNGEPGAKTAND